MKSFNETHLVKSESHSYSVNVLLHLTNLMFCYKTGPVGVKSRSKRQFFDSIHDLWETLEQFSALPVPNSVLLYCYIHVNS